MAYNCIRILLVDDEEDLVEFLSHRLLKKGFFIAAAHSGAEAVAAVERQTFDVAIVDLKMPEMDGIEVLERAKDLQPYLEVLMLTGHGSHESALEAGRLQAYRYLQKPYDFADLLERITEAHEARKQALAKAYQQATQRAIERSGTARELLETQERLRRTYEQD